MQLTWHNYRYYPYERDLAEREVQALLGAQTTREIANGIELIGKINDRLASRLTYFAATVNGHGHRETTQARLESAARHGKKKQATRYSVHGIHEYKGKFNPQVVRALLNIFGVQPGQRVLDPFCGSGTTLVECSHVGAIGIGADINPLAIYIAQAKLRALITPAEQLWEAYHKIKLTIARTKRWKSNVDDDRGSYLSSWFDTNVLDQIETIRKKVEDIAGPLAPVFLVIASNLLREYSQQDPDDLRIRRRKTPIPEMPFYGAFLESIPPILKRIEAAQSVVGTALPHSQALQRDVASLTLKEIGGRFDAAITSPPYAMALPYIDTQRLSLVWLGLLHPDNILELESQLIGSREVRGDARRGLPIQLENNSDSLPKEQARYCLDMQAALGPEDGFRRRAVPMLLYRYFSSMKQSFRSVRAVMKPHAPYGLIVGHNHTTLGGNRWDIDTPAHLASLALSEGWEIEELIPLQTYHRYGYHVSNAVAAETLIILRSK